MTTTTKVFLILASIIFIIWLVSSFNKSSPESDNFSGQKCHPSYSGCLDPNASDYDCIGGSGNGPYYTGRVRVIGPDVFGLDRDGDSWGCE